jgi:hypothetical protein
MNVGSLSFGPAGNIMGPVTFNGSDAVPSAGLAAGSGGSLVVNATGDITVASNIEATTGRVATSQAPTGTGGSVDLNASGGTINVTSRVEVSSAEPASSPAAPRRRSRQGGNISLRSSPIARGGPRPVAINVADSGQLLSLLDAAAPGPGGRITIRASTSSSDVNVKGRVQADRGTVDIRHTGNGGNVNLGGVGNTALNVRGDVVKVATLGTAGVLSIGGGTISADTTLQLYSEGFNGEVRFVASVSLSGNGAKHIAGNIVTINNDVVVSISGPAANVYVNGPSNANYTGFGGNGSTRGTFSRTDNLDLPAANEPQSFANRPPLDPVFSPGG